MRKSLVPLLVLFSCTAALADGYPVIGEPVLKPDSDFEATSWGYKRTDLNLSPAAPANRPADYRWPTLMTMEGYDGASRPAPNAYLRMDDGELMALRIRFGDGPRGDYAFVQASIRGTECSGGHFDLYDRVHAEDGHDIIEWLAAQPWSNGRVGMFGSSYPGQTAYFVATTQPPHLYAISANLLHSDIYRDIFMPGAVQNFLFPSLWTYGLGVVAGPHRIPVNSIEEGTIPADEICLQAQATRYSAGDLFQPQNEPAFAALRATDDQWYRAHAALTYAHTIKIPYYQQGNWQDEQVGPRAVVLWHHIHPDAKTIVDKSDATVSVIPKKYVLSSGDHGHGGYAGRDRWSWFDIWLLDMPDSTGLLDNAVVNTFEAQGDGTGVGTKSGPAWPFPDTQWTNVYLHENGALDFAPPAGPEATDVYLSGISRHGYFLYANDPPVDAPVALPPNFGSDVTTARSLPDVADYESAPLGSDLVIAGPIQMDLYASMLGTDADFFVSISDVWPDGNVSYVQRGMLKASHRAIDPLRSYYVDGAGVSCTGEQRCIDEGMRMVQPYRPHTNPQPVVPGDILRYRIEIFPLGHVFRKDHRLLVQIHTPPVVDGIWGYTPAHQPALVTVYHDADHPSSIQLPVVTPDGPLGPTPTDCHVPAGFPCTPPSALDGIIGG